MFEIVPIVFFYVILNTERIEMIYLVLLTILFGADNGYAQQKSVGNIVMTRGKDVYVYSAGKKTAVEGKPLPFQLYPGDEVQLGMDSDCEVVFANNDTLYAGSETLFSVDWYRNNMNYIWIKYGLLMYRGSTPVVLKASDLFATSKGGDFLTRYKSTTSEITILNFGPDMDVKQGDDEKPYMLKTGRYIKLVSFSTQGKVFGSINTQRVPFIYETFRITFSPKEKELDSGAFKSTDKTDVTPSARSANLDFMKRTIGL
jgi:hypothetical protein